MELLGMVMSRSDLLAYIWCDSLDTIFTTFGNRVDLTFLLVCAFQVRQLAWHWGWLCWDLKMPRLLRTWLAMHRKPSMKRSCEALRLELLWSCMGGWRRQMLSLRVSAEIR